MPRPGLVEEREGSSSIVPDQIGVGAADVKPFGLVFEECYVLPESGGVGVAETWTTEDGRTLTVTMASTTYIGGRSWEVDNSTWWPPFDIDGWWD